MSKNSTREVEFDVIKENVDVEDINDLIKAFLPRKQPPESLMRGIEAVTKALSMTIDKHNLIIPLPIAPHEGSPYLSTIYLMLVKSYGSNMNVIVNELLKPCREGDLHACRDGVKAVKAVIEDGAFIYGLDFITSIMNVIISINSLPAVSKLAESSIYGQYITQILRRSPIPLIEEAQQVKNEAKGE